MQGRWGELSAARHGRKRERAEIIGPAGSTPATAPMKLKDITDTGPLFWRMLGQAVVDRVKKRVRQKHKNVYGQKFKKYDKGYADNKAKGEKSKLGIKGESQSSFSRNPDMTLTGKTMDDFQLRSSDGNGMIVGWSGSAGAVVDHLASKKNYQIVNMGEGDPLSKDEMKFVDRELNKRLDKNIKDYTSKVEVVRIQ